jgi:sugar transferase (PEP-CTERM/EpsH1 system associated)
LNVLIITTRIPYPPYRGDKLKIFNIAKQLAKRNTVTIITFLRSRNQIKEIEELKKYNFKVIYIKISILESCINIIRAIFSSIPFQVAWYRSEEMHKKIKELIVDENYDVAYFHLIRSAQYIVNNTDNSVLQVVDFTDAVSLYLDRFTKIEKNPVKKYLLGIEKKRVEKYEKIAEKFNVVFICSEVDREYLINKDVKANIKILRNGVDIDYFVQDQIKYEKNRIIFTGNMPYYANYDAAIYFAKEIFPQVLKQVPQAKFYIVGQKPPLRVRALANDSVIVTGYVQDIKKEYLKSAVNVAPMRFGAGTLNKIIESIVLGVPVVATPIAAEGLPDEIKKYVCVVNDSNDFTNQVVKFLKDTKLREQFKEQDKSVIRESLSWENIVNQFNIDLKIELSKLKSQ